jgi:hypothetical protein
LPSNRECAFKWHIGGAIDSHLYPIVGITLPLLRIGIEVVQLQYRCRWYLTFRPIALPGTIILVAGNTAIGIEQGAKTIPCGGRRWCNYPGNMDQATA